MRLSHAAISHHAQQNCETNAKFMALHPFYTLLTLLTTKVRLLYCAPAGGGVGVLPNVGCKGMCRCEGYGFQAGYINQSVWV